MVHEKLIVYIRKALRQGYSPPSVRALLLKRGWPSRDVDQAFSSVQTPTLSGGGRGILWKLKTVLLNPTDFFSYSRREGLKPVVIYLAALILVPTIMTALLFSVVLELIFPFPGFESLFDMLGNLGILIAAFVYIGGLMGSFISAGILHIFAFVFGSKRGYSNTYKASVYGSTPSLLGGWVPLLNIALMVWSAYLIIKGLSLLHGISGKKALEIFLMPALIVLVISMLSISIFSFF